MGYTEYTPGEGWSDERNGEKGRDRKNNPDKKSPVPADRGDRDTFIPDVGEISEPDLDGKNIDEPSDSEEPFDFPVPGIMPVTDIIKDKDIQRKKDDDYIIGDKIIRHGILDNPNGSNKPDEETKSEIN